MKSAEVISPMVWKNEANMTPSFFKCLSKRYGQVIYLRMVNNKDDIHCCFLMGKSRVTPKKFVSIPHLELTAAVLSAKCCKFI